MPEKLNILIWDDPRLSQVCELLDDNEFGPQLGLFAQQLIAAMDDKNGIGLAAPQVGVLKRIFVMKFPDHEQMKPLVVCNPTLVLSGPTLYEREGCLSLPSIFQTVPRSENITMQYRDPLGKMKELIIDKWDARVAAHENDHLDGRMFFDRMSRQMRRATLREWEKIKHSYLI
jgi:peptide deformylase